MARTYRMPICPADIFCLMFAFGTTFRGASLRRIYERRLFMEAYQ